MQEKITILVPIFLLWCVAIRMNDAKVCHDDLEIFGKNINIKAFTTQLSSHNEIKNPKWALFLKNFCRDFKLLLADLLGFGLNFQTCYMEFFRSFTVHQPS